METKITKKVDMILDDFDNNPDSIESSLKLMFGNHLHCADGIDGETLALHYSLINSMIDLYETRAKERAALIDNAE